MILFREGQIGELYYVFIDLNLQAMNIKDLYNACHELRLYGNSYVYSIKNNTWLTIDEIPFFQKLSIKLQKSHDHQEQPDFTPTIEVDKVQHYMLVKDELNFIFSLLHESYQEKEQLKNENQHLKKYLAQQQTEFSTKEEYLEAQFTDSKNIICANQNKETEDLNKIIITQSNEIEALQIKIDKYEHNMRQLTINNENLKQVVKSQNDQFHNHKKIRRKL